MKPRYSMLSILKISAGVVGMFVGIVALCYGIIAMRYISLSTSAPTK